MPDSDKSLFTQHEHALAREYGECPECANTLTIKHGKSGPFLGCSAYPTCQYTRPVVEQEKVEDRILSGSECPQCGFELAVKQGRYGMFIGCSNFPACHYIEHEQQAQVAEVDCPSCKKGALQSKTSRYGKTFYSCDQYPKCKFIVNHEPVKGECAKCQYPLLVKRNMAAGEKLQCANKKCGHFQ